MIKLIVFGLIPLSIWAMEPKHRMSWYHLPLKDLIDVNKSKTELEAEEKQEYAAFCQNLYEESRKRLDEVTKETNGYVSETENPEIANYNKLMKRDVLNLCPSDMKVFGFQIENARKDYIKSRHRGI